MKTMLVKFPRSAVYEIHEDVDQVIELLRQCYIDRRQMDGVEWRMATNLLLAVKVACSEAVRQEEAND